MKPDRDPRLKPGQSIIINGKGYTVVDAKKYVASSPDPGVGNESSWSGDIKVRDDDTGEERWIDWYLVHARHPATDPAAVLDTLAELDPDE